MGYFDFQKKSDCIMCIDSDGCAMDTMEVKHRTCFGPQWIKTFGLTEHEAECMELWLSINLYSITRGINRFKGLALALAEVEKRGLGNIEGLAEYDSYIVRWHEYVKQLQAALPGLSEDNVKILNTFNLRVFYMTTYAGCADDKAFYAEFDRRLAMAKEKLGLM